MSNSKSIIHQARVYICACKHDRIKKLPEQLEKLNVPYVIEKELPSPEQHSTCVLFDATSRRMRQQVIAYTHRPLLWLEDDIDIPENFWGLWEEYEESLPCDWQAAVIGWGIIVDNGTKIRRVSKGWWHLEKDDKPSEFLGVQAVLFNSGEWRKLLGDLKFRCDMELCDTLEKIGITQIYHADKILIGTNDPLTTFGYPVIQYPKMSDPQYWSWEKFRYRNIDESDFV